MHAGHRNLVFTRIVKDPFAGLHGLVRIHIIPDRYFGKGELDPWEMDEVAEDQKLSLPFFSKNETWPGVCPLVSSAFTPGITLSPGSNSCTLPAYCARA